MQATIREESEQDEGAIRQVVRLAFGQQGEAQLVDDLRGGGHLRLSLVALIEDRIVGHVAFSPLSIVNGETEVSALALAPVAVDPRVQRQGIGSALIRRGLELCRQRQERIVIVLGDPRYYRRFGFSSELCKRLLSAYAGENFMALELLPSAMQGVAGEVRYPPPFQAI